MIEVRKFSSSCTRVQEKLIKHNKEDDPRPVMLERAKFYNNESKGVMRSKLSRGSKWVIKASPKVQPCETRRWGKYERWTVIDTTMIAIGSWQEKAEYFKLVTNIWTVSRRADMIRTRSQDDTLRPLGNVMRNTPGWVGPLLWKDSDIPHMWHHRFPPSEEVWINLSFDCQGMIRYLRRRTSLEEVGGG